MSFNYSKLAGRIKEKFKTQSAFASAMEMSERTLSQKLNNKIAMKQDEILKACELLEVPMEEMHLYFFNL